MAMLANIDALALAETVSEWDRLFDLVSIVD